MRSKTYGIQGVVLTEFYIHDTMKLAWDYSRSNNELECSVES